MDVNIAIDELVVDGSDDEALADRLAAAVGGVLATDVASQVNSAVLAASTALPR